MIIRMKHLRHPLRTASLVRERVAGYLDRKRVADYCERRFRGDARYDLQNVANGFVSRVDDAADDAELLERICTAYIKSVEQQQSAPEIYQATEWWQRVRQRSLEPVMQALKTKDDRTLSRIYRNFFRDPCSTGLVGVPWGMSQALMGGAAKRFHRRLYLGDVLYRIAYWEAQTGSRFSIVDLAGPGVGNPFGIEIDGTLVTTGAAYQHYCAQRIGSELGPDGSLVAEIGGGFGGMAYYLLRDRAKLTYLDFDVPESIALTSYYLMKAFPKLNFFLYGERALTMEEIARADVVLMPVFEMEKMPSQSVDVVFSSHAISDLSQEVVEEYMERIRYMTRSSFVCIGQGSTAIPGRGSESADWFRLAETRSSGWHSHTHPAVNEVECVYRVSHGQACSPDDQPGRAAICR